MEPRLRTIQIGANSRAHEAAAPLGALQRVQSCEPAESESQHRRSARRRYRQHHRSKNHAGRGASNVLMRRTVDSGPLDLNRQTPFQPDAVQLL